MPQPIDPTKLPVGSPITPEMRAWIKSDDAHAHIVNHAHPARSKVRVPGVWNVMDRAGNMHRVVSVGPPSYRQTMALQSQGTPPFVYRSDRVHWPQFIAFCMVAFAALVLLGYVIKRYWQD